MLHRVFDIYGFIILIIVFIILFIAESRFKLRKRVEPRIRRIVRNAIMSLPAFVLLRFMLLPAMIWLAVRNEGWHFGLNYLFVLPAWIENMIAFIMLDYGIYWWHIIMHKMPLMWRFHLVHHIDKDMDVSTAFRFHFGEMIGSLFFRGALVLLTGASPIMVLIYEIIFEAETQFHHSNTKLPLRIERILNKIIVTPRMHGIHHSIIKHETDSNYATIFTFWDRLHKTIRLNIHQDEIIIGVPVYHNADNFTIADLLKLPFIKTKPWKDEVRETTGNKNDLKG